MADIWLGRFSRFLEKLLNAKGGPVLLDVSPSLQTVLQLELDPGNLHLQSVERYSTFVAIAGVAAQKSFVQLRNPAGSGVIAIVEFIGVGPSTSTVSTFDLSENPGQTLDAATTTRGSRWDLRNLSQSAAIMSGSNAAAPDFPTILLSASGNNTTTWGNIPMLQGILFPLLPGDTIRVTDETVNEAMTVQMIWRERVLESSELT